MKWPRFRRQSASDSCRRFSKLQLVIGRLLSANSAASLLQAQRVHFFVVLLIDSSRRSKSGYLVRAVNRQVSNNTGTLSVLSSLLYYFVDVKWHGVEKCISFARCLCTYYVAFSIDYFMCMQTNGLQCLFYKFVLCLSLCTDWRRSVFVYRAL